MGQGRHRGARLASLCAEAVDAGALGYNILIVSDRASMPIMWRFRHCWRRRPSTITWWRRALRTSAGLVVETGSAREVHHFALLAGYGAEAVHPYLAMETLADMATGLFGDLSPEKAVKNFVKAIGKGLFKVMSKMGISTYMSYTGAQIFEAIGLSRELVQSISTARRPTWKASASSKWPRKPSACTATRSATTPYSRPCSMPAASTPTACVAEEHMWTPDSVAKLQHSVRADDGKGMLTRRTRNTRTSSTTRAAAT